MVYVNQPTFMVVIMVKRIKLADIRARNVASTAIGRNEFSFQTLSDHWPAHLSLGFIPFISQTDA